MRSKERAERLRSVGRVCHGGRALALTDLQLVQLRRRLRRGGGLPDELHAELKEAAGRVFRLGRLPRVYAPQGVWNEQAEEDAFHGWLTKRLEEEGALQALLDKARDAAAFRYLAEQNFRQYLAKARERSESQNLYKRLSAMLRSEPEQFRCFREARRPQDRWWGLAGWEEPETFGGSDERLEAQAWGLGDFSVFRYGATAGQLGPVLKTPELRRFITALLSALQACLSLTLMMRALQSRFQLDDPAPEALDEELAAAGSAATSLMDRETATAILIELSGRQTKIMLARDEGRAITNIAEELGCAAGTVSNEQDAALEVFRRHVVSDDDLAPMVKKVIDLVYEPGEDP